MVFGGNGMSLDKIHMSVGGWMELTYGIWKRLEFDLACSSDKAALVLSTEMEPTKALKHPAAVYAFCHFWAKSDFLHMGSGSWLGEDLACILILIHISV